MIQDIFPRVYHNEYKDKKPKQDSLILIFHDQKVLARDNQGEIEYPTYAELGRSDLAYIYLFQIDKTDYFLADTEENIALNGYSYEDVSSLRMVDPRHTAFAGTTAYHLFNWYQNNKYCGRCGNRLEHDKKERMLHCNTCKNTVYPTISPAIIVAITDGDRLLMTKYAGREYTKYALVAGFSEIGESAEKTVEREVMEEVGLKVKNITYFKSQPWAHSGSLLMGYFAELDGDATITLDEEELSEAGWFRREDILIEDDEISLTREMIHKFKMEL